MDLHLVRTMAGELVEVNEAMPDDEQPAEPRSYSHQRATDNLIVETVRNVDSGVSTFWRLGSILATLLCTAFILGTQWFAFKDMRKQLDTLQRSDEARTKKDAAADTARQLKERDEQYFKQRVLERVADLERFEDKQTTAYNFVISNGVAEVRGRLGMKQLVLPQFKREEQQP